MGTVPLVESFIDVRNLATILFYVTIATFAHHILTSRNVRYRRTMMLAWSLIVFPFIPASNMFFPVGFVIAERILYLPSMGFCMLVAYGLHNLLAARSQESHEVLSDRQTAFLRWNDTKKLSKVLYALLVITVIAFCAKTVNRNNDWKSEYSLFMSGLKVTQNNAKLFNNVGHALEKEDKFEEALEYFLKATQVQPDDVGAHINVGRTYVNLEKFDFAEGAFLRAKNLLPRARKGERYQARIAPSHLNVFLNLANLISRNKSRLEEADALYRQAISMRADYIQAYINRGDVLVQLNRTQEALEVYEKALHFDKNNADIYYNVSESHART